jgi:hypothetical protein
MHWQVHGQVQVSGDLVDPRGFKLGDKVRLLAHQSHGDGRWRRRGDGSWNGRRDRRGDFPHGQVKLIRKLLRVFLRKLED